MDLLDRLPPDLWPDFWIGVSASLAAAILWSSRHSLDRLLRHFLNEWSRQRPSVEWNPRLGTDPKVLVGEAFQQLRALDSRLGRIASPAAREPGQRLLFVICLFLHCLSALIFAQGVVALPFAWLTFLTTSLVTAIIVTLCRPDKAPIIIALFPLSLLLLFVLPARRLDRKRADIIIKARCHLLLAIPSTRSVRAVLQRKDEHLAHVKCMQVVLSQLLADPEVGREIDATLIALRGIAKQLEVWPSDCSALISLSMPELSQITADEDESGIVQE